MTRSVSDGTGAETGSDERVAPALPERILQALITCLDEIGYAATSIQRIQERAGVSRGALTYHFASKEDLMVEAAEHLLRPTQAPRRLQRRQPRLSRADVVADIEWMWTKLVDTREGRALMEILLAARCDPVLRARISPTFSRWNRNINDRLLAICAGTGQDPETLTEIWSIARVFMRGLNTQRQFDDHDAQIKALIDRFGRILAALLVPEDPPAPAAPAAAGNIG